MYANHTDGMTLETRLKFDTRIKACEHLKRIGFIHNSEKSSMHSDFFETKKRAAVVYTLSEVSVSFWRK